jgi:hypothetical protein
MKCYVQLRKELLDHLEDLMTQASLVGSTVCTRSKKGGSVVSRMSSPSVKSVNTKASKVSEASNPKETVRTSEYYSQLDFYPTNLRHTLMPKPDFEGYRQEFKKPYESDQEQYRIAQTFWMKICIKCQTTQVHSCLGSGIRLLAK